MCPTRLSKLFSPSSTPFNIKSPAPLRRLVPPPLPASVLPSLPTAPVVVIRVPPALVLETASAAALEVGQRRVPALRGSARLPLAAPLRPVALRVEGREPVGPAPVAAPGAALFLLLRLVVPAVVGGGGGGTFAPQVGVLAVELAHQGLGLVELLQELGVRVGGAFALPFALSFVAFELSGDEGLWRLEVGVGANYLLFLFFDYSRQVNVLAFDVLHVQLELAQFLLQQLHLQWSYVDGLWARIHLKRTATK